MRIPSKILKYFYRYYLYSAVVVFIGLYRVLDRLPVLST